MNNIFNKVKDIVSAYKIMLNPNDTQEEIAMERLLVCHNCPFLKENSAGIKYCGQCGCVIKAKIYSKNNNCPENKWTR
jgi:hypothetical protein